MSRKISTFGSLLQTALVKLYVAWPRLSRDGREEAYVRQIIVRANIDEHRRPWRRERPGLDGHDRGVKIVARILRDAGFEVIYTGLFQTPDTVAAAAVDEDVDAIGLSMLSGAHMTLFERLIALLDERDARDIMVFGGGIIPQADIPALKELGVAEVFTPGAPTTAIVEWVRTHVADAAPDSS